MTIQLHELRDGLRVERSTRSSAGRTRGAPPRAGHRRGGSRRAVAVLALGCATLLGLALEPARAQGDASLERLRAERLAAQGRCEDALEILARLREVASSDARAARLQGQCLLRLKQYPAAVRALEEARRLDPQDGETALHLGMARFHMGDLAAAEEALRDAEARLGQRPETDLYLGLLALQRAESQEAEARLERVRAAGRGLEPLASYYAGLAASAAGERRRARERLERVRREHPETSWAREAEARLQRLGSGRSGDWWVEATTGWEYDDNVVLRGSGVQLPEEIASAHDHRAMWSLEAGTELYSTRDWTVGLLATYYGTAQQDLSDFNVQFPGLSLWIDRRLGEKDLARFQYDFGYAWVGGSDPFLAMHTWTPAWYRSWGEAGTTRVSAAFDKRNYLFPVSDVPDGPGTTGALCGTSLCGPAGLDESQARNRDGWGVRLGIEHTLPLDVGLGRREAKAGPAPGERNARFFLRGGYTYHRYSARGTEYSYQGHEVFTGVRALLPWDISFETTVSYQWRPYRHPSSYPDPEDLFVSSATGQGLQYDLSGKDRSDDLFSVQLVLERPITDALTLSARYAYYDQASNVDVFDYDREVFGLYATFRFGP